MSASIRQYYKTQPAQPTGRRPRVNPETQKRNQDHPWWVPSLACHQAKNNVVKWTDGWRE